MYSIVLLFLFPSLKCMFEDSHWRDILIAIWSEKCYTLLQMKFVKTSSRLLISCNVCNKSGEAQSLKATASFALLTTFNVTCITAICFIHCEESARIKDLYWGNFTSCTNTLPCVFFSKYVNKFCRKRHV